MSSELGKIVADFRTSLAVKMAVGATTGTLQSATDDDGVALPAGTYYFTIDGDNSQKEHIKCSLSGTALTSVYSVSRQGVKTSGAAREHRIGASVTITNFAHIKEIADLVGGNTDLNASDPLKYDGVATLTPGSNQLATVAYADAISLGGAPDASGVTKGVTKLSVAAAVPTNPIAVGDNDGRVPTQAENDALVGNNTTIAVGSGNKYVTQTGLQNSAEVYAASSAGTDTYAITVSPVPTAYAAGQTFRFKADVANTGAATLNVNTLGAISITKNGGSALEDNDIKAGQVVTVVYDSTGPKFQIQSLDKMSQANATTLTAGVTSGADELHTHTLNNIFLQSLGTGRQIFNTFDLCDRTANSGFTETVFTACTIIELASSVSLNTPAANGQGGKIATTNLATDPLANGWTLGHSYYQEVILLQTTLQDVFFGIGASVTIAGANGTSTTRHIGFFIEDATIWASNGDGAAQTRTNVSSGITLTAANTFSWDFTPSTNIKFYINGTLVATHTTNLPGTNGTDFELVSGIASATNVAKQIYFYRRIHFLMKEV